MTTHMMLNLMMLIICKHFVVDFLMQPPYMYKNKGTYGHPGGYLHAMFHMLATVVILCYFIDHSIACMLAISEGIIHYHIDWAKMNIGRLCEWKPDNSEWFWMLMGLDQFLHYMTYMFMFYLILRIPQ